MNSARIYNNSQGSSFVFTMLALAGFSLLVIAYFVIKNYEVRLLKNKEAYISTHIASEGIFRKYAFLAKRGNPNNWRVGAVAELYNSNDHEADQQIWTMINPVPYKISYLKAGSFVPIPAVLNFNNGVLQELENINIIRLENIPVSYEAGDGQTKYTYITVTFENIVSEEEGEDNLDIKVISSLSPIVYR